MDAMTTYFAKLRQTALATFTGLCVLWAGYAFADDVQVASGNGFGRIIFQWNDPVRYAADVLNGQLVVQFERPVISDVETAARLIPRMCKVCA